MSGRIVLVTGATRGLGEAAARALARLDDVVVAVGRNEARGRAAVERIRRDTGNPHVEFLQADLGSQASVRRLAEDFLQRHRRLDVLIHNAGALHALRRESVDGIEATLALDHLAAFLLTHLLLDILRSSAPSRIVVVSSSAHADVPAFDFDDPELRARRPLRRAYPRSEWTSMLFALAMPWAHPGYRQYARCRLAGLLFTHELARRLEGTGVTVNAVDPGLVTSGFAGGNGLYGWFVQRWSRLLGRSAEEAAKELVRVASAPELARSTGEYFVRGAPVASSPASMDRAAAARLWSLSEQLCGIAVTAPPPAP